MKVVFQLIMFIPLPQFKFGYCLIFLYIRVLKLKHIHFYRGNKMLESIINFYLRFFGLLQIHPNETIFAIYAFGILGCLMSFMVTGIIILFLMNDEFCDKINNMKFLNREYDNSFIFSLWVIGFAISPLIAFIGIHYDIAALSYYFLKGLFKSPFLSIKKYLIETRNKNREYNKKQKELKYNPNSLSLKEAENLIQEYKNV